MLKVTAEYHWNDAFWYALPIGEQRLRIWEYLERKQIEREANEESVRNQNEELVARDLARGFRSGMGE